MLVQGDLKSKALQETRAPALAEIATKCLVSKAWAPSALLRCLYSFQELGQAGEEGG